MSCSLRKILTRERMQSSDFSRDSGVYPPIVVAVWPTCYFFHNFSPGHVFCQTAERRGDKTSTRQVAICPHPLPSVPPPPPTPPLCLALSTPPSQETTKGPLCESRVTRVTQRHITVLSDCHTAARAPTRSRSARADHSGR